jgi:hypothetical protein
MNLERDCHEFLVVKFDIGGSFGVSLARDCHEFEVTQNLDFYSHLVRV